MSTETIVYKPTTDSWIVASKSDPGKRYEIEAAWDSQSGQPTGGYYCHVEGQPSKPCKGWQFCRGSAAQKSCSHIRQVLAAASSAVRVVRPAA